MQFEKVRITNCIFENVIFKNHTKTTCCIEECEFINCEFHDTFRDEELDDILLVLMNNIFTQCLFENISFYGYNEQSEILHSKFANCNFKNIQLEGNLAIAALTLSEGNVECFSFKGLEIRDNCLINVKLKDLDLKAAVYFNKLENVVFKDVKLTGRIDKNDFINCDESGFTFIPNDNW